MSILSKNINDAVTLLENGELVAIPTETVYGLAGNIFSKKAIMSIFKTKNRPHFNPLIVHISSIDYLSKVAEDIPDKAKLLADAFWPGPITLVLKKKSTIPDLVTAGKNTVAVRIPDHPMTLKLLKVLDFPLAAPSANPFNRISPTTANHVENYFKNDIKMVLDGGACKKGIESTIIGFENKEPIIYRLGSTSIEAIEAIVGRTEIKNLVTDNSSHDLENPLAPGMLARHYAPKTKTILVDNIQETIKKYKGNRIGILSFKTEFKAVDFQIILSKEGNIKEAAAKLYNALHQLDTQNLDVIIAERFPNSDLGKTINDRLTRAAK